MNGGASDVDDFQTVRPIFEEFYDLVKVNDTLARKSGPHFGGGFRGQRLFGGQSVAQAYSATRLLCPDLSPARVDINFLAPGTVTDDLFFRIVHKSSDFLRIDLEQKGKLIANIFMRVKSRSELLLAEPFPSHSVFPAGIGHPLDYANIRAYLKHLPHDQWKQHIGPGYRYSKRGELYLFDWRPVDIQHYAGITHEHKPVEVWGRLSNNVEGMSFGQVELVADLPVKDPLTIPILMSDWIVGHPAVLHHEQLKVKFGSSASLTHKCIFHLEDFDPHGFFFIQFDFDILNGTALMRGRLFDERRRLVMTYLQDHFYVSNAQDLAQFHGAKL